MCCRRRWRSGSREGRRKTCCLSVDGDGSVGAAPVDAALNESDHLGFDFAIGSFGLDRTIKHQERSAKNCATTPIITREQRSGYQPRNRHVSVADTSNCSQNQSTARSAGSIVSNRKSCRSCRVWGLERIVCVLFMLLLLQTRVKTRLTNGRLANWQAADSVCVSQLL